MTSKHWKKVSASMPEYNRHLCNLVGQSICVLYVPNQYTNYTNSNYISYYTYLSVK